MTQEPLDWDAIRPLNGGREKGFEEMCSQLARCEAPPVSSFVRKGMPDAGVECYAILRDGSEWAWQSKYFGSLEKSQWSQIDDSVKAAIEKHPRLAQYFVCIPVDLSDARIPGQKSAKNRWDDHVAKWEEWAKAKGMSVTFVYWGSHELLHRLARTEHAGRVHFWFGKRGFDEAWFSSRLDEAIRTASARYTPEIHVDLPVAQEFEAFGRTERFFDRIKALALNIHDELRRVKNSGSPNTDAELDDNAANFFAKVQVLLEEFGSLKTQATGALPFQAIVTSITKAVAAAEELSDLLEKRETVYDAKPSHGDESDGTTTRRPHRANPFHERRISVRSLAAELCEVSEEVRRADEVASARLLLIRGAAGTGKTHLLCDIAQKRIAESRPTVLLMGQHFVSYDAPWMQAMQHLDLPGLSAEKFIGALEAAAQARGARALLMIDAINEGRGRRIWPSHLEAFLAHAERSTWIGVVLSVRTSYEQIVLPDEVRERAAKVTHHGFEDHEYDAAKTFFVHYGLELPSTPLLAPEFRNPLFLKTICSGLQAKGERRLPRGLHGITAVFELYLAAINKRLADQLEFNPRANLVRRALDEVAATLVDSGNRWLTVERAASIIDALLPNREFERSLYRGLVVEGLLAEDAPRSDDSRRDIVYMAYERFADHLVAKALLDRHLSPSNAATAFSAEGKLSFVANRNEYISPGLLEALCIQVAERCGQELVTLAPGVAERWGIGEAFRQSLVWRAVTAFSDGTRLTLNKLCRRKSDLHATLDVLLTVAMLPGHPLNARFLDSRLRKPSMAERDAWWSIYIHHAWQSHGAVDRLVDWASYVIPETPLEDEIVDLGASTLAWMLTTSNRFLRDRVTKALVSLLTGRLGAATRLVQQFADVNDVYVTERVYATAYGVATRSQDPVEVGALAAAVYKRVFAVGTPPTHVLLRDYARGVVERGLYLDPQLTVDPSLIRPPYKSQWPTIPSEEDIKPFLADWSKGSHDSGEIEWSHNSIANSVLYDDFARYVIGTNSSKTSRSWLLRTLDEAPWTPPPRRKDLLRSWVDELSTEELIIWNELEAAKEAHDSASQTFVADWYSKHEKDAYLTLDRADEEALAQQLAQSSHLMDLHAKKREVLAKLEDVLTEEHLQRLTDILGMKDDSRDARCASGLDLRQIQRYILWRVFDLGWTMDRFGHFDRFSTKYQGREASKAERIGKKYQWIAYHEILALVSDRFQYREAFREEDGDKVYEGPWQDGLRDIDPSCTLRAAKGGTSWDGHETAWWGQTKFDAWASEGSERDWILRTEDLPKVEELLLVTNPKDGVQWLNVQGSFGWEHRPPADRKSTELARSELWYICTGFLIRKDDTHAFLKWAEGVESLAKLMPEPAQVYQMFLGEHAWAPSSRYFERHYYDDDGWTQPEQGCPAKVRTAAFKYLRELSGFDCSIDESYTLRLPVRELVDGLGLRWTGKDADFVDIQNRLAAQDPTAQAKGPNALLMRMDLLQDFLTRAGLVLCWEIFGEKRILDAGFGRSHHPDLVMSGAYVMGQTGISGFVKRILNDYSGDTPTTQIVDVYRCGT